MRFEFATATRIIFGEGTLQEVGPAAAELGQRALVVTGGDISRAQPLLNALAERNLTATAFAVEEEPTVELVQEGVETIRSAKRDMVISMGGGSAIDTGKAIAALATHGGQPLDYLEVIGKGQPLINPPLPFIAIPTTAGTGSEVTRNAVLASHQHRVKVSLRSAWMLPRLAIVDPELTYSLPPAVTARTGMDALTQVLESYVSKRATPLTDPLCREGLMRAGRSLRRAYQSGDDPDARRDMALASLMGGLALANAKLGAVHGFAGPLGGMFNAPHGGICATLLPHVMATNIRLLPQHDGTSLDRYDEIARLLTGRDDATAHDGIAFVESLCEALQVPTLSHYGVTEGDFPAIIDKSARSSSMQGNPLDLSREEMAGVLKAAL